MKQDVQPTKEDPMTIKRWHIHIEPGTGGNPLDLKSVDADFDEIHEAGAIVEGGPDWSNPGYEITITYNDPCGIRAWNETQIVVDRLLGVRR
jgi:hypothetical protein